MLDNITIARPYAKGLFNHALSRRQLADWSLILQALAQVVLDPKANQFIGNPNSSVELQIRLLWSVLEELRLTSIDEESIRSLLSLLAANQRLLLLPAICAQFESLRSEQEKTLTAQVRAFSELSDEQQTLLIRSLSQRLQRHVELDISIDRSLLGGAVIQAGDLVIDGSVRGKLEKLGTELAA